MGVQTRTGATGRGLCYSILSVVTNKYLDGQWQVSGEIPADELALLKKAASLSESVILEKNGMDLITDEEWEILNSTVYRKLFSGKKVVVQGSGKVGSSILKELDRYGVNVIAVSDAGGAVIGQNLDVDVLVPVSYTHLRAHET